MAESSPAAIAETLAALVPKLRRRLREHGTLGDLKPSYFAVLRQLEREGELTAAKLAAAEGMRPQSMSAIVAELQAEGLVEAAPDPHDGRQTLLSVTALCRKRMKATRAARRDWLARALHAELSPAEQKELAEALPLLERIADA